jgi:hypothetical protein
MSSTFLTPKEVAELTGIQRGRNGRSYAEMQVDWLLRQGYPARLNAAGRAIVPRSAVEGTRQAPPPKQESTWMPDAWR